MNDDQQTDEQSFAAFEAQAKEPDSDQRQEDDAPPAEVNDKKDEPLELGGEDAPQLTDEQKAEEEEKRTRSRHPNQRIAHYRWQAGEAERQRDEALARLAAIEGGKSPADPVAEIMARKPDPYAKNEDGSDKYEWGANDPKFAEDLTEWKVEATLADRDKKAKETDDATAGQREVVGRLNDGMANLEKVGTEKYPDFAEKIESAVEARGGESLPAPITVAAAMSPVGADIAYRLATDDATAEKIETLAKTNLMAFAIAIGELEGQYLDTDDDNDLNPADQGDMARMLGRERARRKGLTGTTPVERKVTSAPEPPEHKSRGANGQFETRPDTDDFAAFERLAKRSASK